MNTYRVGRAVMQSAAGLAYQQALLEGKSEEEAQRIADEAGKDALADYADQEWSRAKEEGKRE